MTSILDLPETHRTASCEPAAQPFASLTHITKRYSNGIVALDDLSLALGRGEIVALLGANGAGKSTAVKLMMGLSTPSSGSVHVFGADPRQTAARLRTGAMLQVGRAPEMLRVCEHIEIFRGYYPDPMPYAELIQVAALEEIETRMFGQLSGGQKQRVLFALALAGDPDLIFLDEPTVGLDVEARRRMWTQIRVLAQRGKTVLLTTHYLEEADALAHRIIVLNKGRVLCEGTPAQIKSFGSASTSSSGGRSIKTIRCTTSLSAAVCAGLSGVVQSELAGAALTLSTSQPEQALRELLALDADLQSIEVTSPALEDAFLALTSSH